MPKYIAGAREAMGGVIDLDPASCAAANLIVQAERYYTQEQNGLAQDWTCKRMWLNPPYGKVNGRSLCGMFIQRLIDEYKTGRVEQAILLAMDDTSTKWFQLLRDYPICFANHKVHFYTTRPTPKKPTASHRHGTIFVYLGQHEDRFIDVFCKFGDIWRRVSRDIASPAPLSLWSEAS